ncbi:MAG: alpha-L-rhamnosidase C-terminal domain-containing protein, partial [Rhodothermales bacterium]
YHFLATICGIRPGAAGFKEVHIEPALGRLDWIQGSVPHPLGDIRVDLRPNGEVLVGYVELPPGVNGTLSWRGWTVRLTPGRTSLL